MEYFERKQSLDGTWRLYIEENAKCKDWFNHHDSLTEEDLKQKGLTPIEGSVPGNFELDMEKAGLLCDLFYDTNILKARYLENRHLWYVRNFTFEGKPCDRDFLLFEGVDTEAQYFLNGEYICCSDNMMIEHRFCGIEEILREGENELIVHIEPSAIASRNRKLGAGITTGLSYHYGSLYFRKAASTFGWDIAPRLLSGGIWKSVYLCRKKRERINSVYMYSHEKGAPTGQLLYYDVDIEGDYGTEYYIWVQGICGDSVFETKKTLWHTEARIYVPIPNVKLWWPKNMGEQNLYNVTVRLMHGSEVCDERTFRHGVRRFELKKSDYIDADGNGDFHFEVNGEYLFIMGTNWVPLDAFHSRDRERLPLALALLGESGCNAVRLWGGNVYPDEEFYDYCDQNGIVVWQDFAMACATYPQDTRFCNMITDEVRSVVKKFRSHASLMLWSGDNEVDTMHMSHRDPNKNAITREVIPAVLEMEDPLRIYLPSSPYVSQRTYDDKMTHRLPEDHLWGPRKYYKQDFYKNSVAKFASETGYHGCVSPESIERFIAPENQWPALGNDAWILHATSPETDENSQFAYRIKIMHEQLDILFGGTVPDELYDFCLASQISQAEAVKYFIERFRVNKGEKHGIIWWNLLDGWPQFSDAVIDYYGKKKLAFPVIKRSQLPVCLFCDEPQNGEVDLCVGNERRREVSVHFTVSDVATGKTLFIGNGVSPANSTAFIKSIPLPSDRGMLLLEFECDGESFKNHYLYGEAPFDYHEVVELYKKAGILELEGF